MSAVNGDTDPRIKSEGERTLGSLLDHSPSTPQKRRRSSSTGSGEKRQRIGSYGSIPPYDDEEFRTMLAKVTASATQEIQKQQNKERENSQISRSPIAALPSSPAKEQEEENVQDSSLDYFLGFSSDPHIYMRIFSLPILESLALQVLGALAQENIMDAIDITTKPETELGQAYDTLRALFIQTKKIYSQKKAFLSAEELNIRDPRHREIIRITNLATFASGVFKGDIGFFELNDNFVDSFAPQGIPLETEPCQLFVDLKTQMYLSAMCEPEGEIAMTKEDHLDKYFPDDIGAFLQERHPGEPMNSAENDMLGRYCARKAYLSTEPSSPGSIKIISQMHPWESFLGNIIDHLKNTYENSLAPYTMRNSLTSQTLARRETFDGMFSTDCNTIMPSIERDSFARATELAVQETLKALGSTDYHPMQNGGSQQYYKREPSGTFYSPVANMHNTTGDLDMTPTSVLYEKARQQAAQKSNPQQKRPGISQRRPWTEEEEKALMSGLDQVKGPHWSHILALYGENGTISNVLKDRNQVQLKDKARNLKLFFLKSDIGVPKHLQAVTGELKTRAPSQAARKEADLRQRANEDGTMKSEENSVEPHDMQSSLRNNESSLTCSPPSQETSGDMSPERLVVVAPEPEMYEATPPTISPISPVHPLSQGPAPSSPGLNSDDLLRRSLLAATAAVTDEHDRLGPDMALANGYFMAT